MSITISSDIVKPTPGMKVVHNRSFGPLYVGFVGEYSLQGTEALTGGSVNPQIKDVRICLDHPATLWVAAVQLWNTTRGSEDAVQAGTTAPAREFAIDRAMKGLATEDDIEIIRNCLIYHAGQDAIHRALNA